MQRFNGPLGKTFRPCGGEGQPVDHFESVGDPVYSCPPSVIARVALRRLAPGAELQLPTEADRTGLVDLEQTAGRYSRAISFSTEQARTLGCIGRQLLDLNERGMVQPPLHCFELATIQYLIDVVATSMEAVEVY